MKGIVEVNGQHLMAPSVEVAAKIVTLIGKCRPMVESYVQRPFRTNYTPAEPEDFEGRFTVSLKVVNDEQILARVPRCRRIMAPAPEGGKP